MNGSEVQIDAFTYILQSVSQIQINEGEMIIFGLNQTTLELGSIFGGSWGNIENWLEAKTEPPSGNLACQNR